MRHMSSDTRPSIAGVLDGSCMDCGIDTMAQGEYYGLKDPVWRACNPLLIGYLCLACAEDRLGRDLHAGDFSPPPINGSSAEHCAALADRLQRSAPSTARSGPPGNADGECELIEGIQRRLALEKQPRSELGAALLPYRGRDGRVLPETAMRVLRGLTRTDRVS